MIRVLNLIRDLIFNLFLGHKYDLFYVVENHNWVTDYEWGSVSEDLNSKGLIRSRTTSTCLGLRNKVIHYGSISTFINRHGLKLPHLSNKLVLTWFHVVPDDKRLRFVDEINKQVTFIHTACNITKNKLIEAGINKEKIVVVPLGIDLGLFRSGDKSIIEKTRKKMNIKLDEIVIGSFQKDGNGWGLGKEPKLIKGPDIFCNLVIKLAKKYPIHVLLTGPARGYVIKRLKDADVKYTHIYLKKFNDIVQYYQILNLYPICSREEGGPKSLLESMACGVPLVSTRVGMAPDIIRDGYNAYLVNVGDDITLYDRSVDLLDNRDKQAQIIKCGYETIQNYKFELISRIYFDKIYSKLIR